MPCCLCCHFEEDLNVVTEKNQKRIKGLAETHGLVKDPHPLALKENEKVMQKRKKYSVHLNIYDLISNKKNKNLQKVGMALYHSGVEVGPWEYSFGEPQDSSVVTGIFIVRPMTAMDTLCNRLYLGDTILSQEAFDTLVQRMKVEWPATRYELLHRNCNHFAAWFCKRLSTVQPLRVPAWVNRIANAGDCVTPRCVARWAVRKFDDKGKAPPKSNSKNNANAKKDSDSKKEAEAKKKQEVERKQREANKELEAKKKQQQQQSKNGKEDVPRPNLIAAAQPTAGGGSTLLTSGGAMPNFNAGREPPKAAQQTAVAEPAAGKKLPTVSEAREQTITGGKRMIKFEFGDFQIPDDAATVATAGGDNDRAPGAPTAPRNREGTEADLSDIHFSDDNSERSGGSGPRAAATSTAATSNLLRHQQQQHVASAAEETEEKIALIMSMGFDDPMAVEIALQAADGDVDHAVEFLFGSAPPPAHMGGHEEEEMVFSPHEKDDGEEDTAALSPTVKSCGDHSPDAASETPPQARSDVNQQTPPPDVDESSFGTPVVPHVQGSKEREESSITTPMVLSTGTFNRLEAEEERRRKAETTRPVEDQSQVKLPSTSLLLEDKEDDSQKAADQQQTGLGMNQPVDGCAESAREKEQPVAAPSEKENTDDIPPAELHISSLLRPHSTSPPPSNTRGGFVATQRQSHWSSASDSEDDELEPTTRTKTEEEEKVALEQSKGVAKGIQFDKNGELILNSADLVGVKRGGKKHAGRVPPQAPAYVDPATGESALPELNIDPAEIPALLKEASKKTKKAASTRDTTPPEDEDPAGFSDAEDDGN